MIIEQKENTVKSLIDKGFMSVSITPYKFVFRKLNRSR